MRIGFDAKRAFLNASGLGNYSRTLLNSLVAEFPQHEYVLYTPKRKRHAAFNFPPKNSPFEIILPEKIHHKGLPSVWRSKWLAGQLQNDKIDIFHGLSHELPYGIHEIPVKTVVTIHDLIFLHYPEYYTLVDRKIYAQKFRYACETAHKIIAVSEATKNDIVEFFGIRADKIEVIHQGCGSAFAAPQSPEKQAALRKKYGLPGDFVLYLGAIAERKNVVELVETLAKTPDEIQLVLAGKGGKYLENVERAVRENGLERRVKILGEIPDADAPVLYSMARIFAYPSQIEGFGIPIIEALSARVPVITATHPVFREAAGPGSLFADPHDAAAFGQAITALWGDAERRAQMAEAGARYVRRFDRAAQAGKVMGMYEQLLTSRPGGMGES